MNGIAIAFLLVNCGMLLFLPRPWAPLPLLFGACYMTIGQGITLGPFSFSIVRILVVIGFLRAALRREWLAGGTNRMDFLMLLFAFAALLSSTGHADPSGALIFRMGIVFNTCGMYFLFRIFCHSFESLVGLCRFAAILLLPVAIEMIFEHFTRHNSFSIFGGVPISPAIREGKLRAQGPFMHAILAGTVGAVCFPLMIGIWRKYRKTATIGICGCLLMVFASNSSGPIMSTVAAAAALFMWRWRHQMRLVRWLAVLGYILLDFIMVPPAYFVLSRIDLTGSSAGWHRAELIRAAITHLNEWWLWGTDYTRHWMPTGVSWNPDHTDITNYYLHFGVVGGLPLMLLHICILITGFVYVGKTIKNTENTHQEAPFFFWAIGAALFSHAATGISVSYFDQSYIFLYMTLAIISSSWSVTRPKILRA